LSGIEKIEAAVFRAVDDVSQLLPADQRLRKSADTPLTGSNAVLDSLGLVNFLVAVESSIAESLGVSISLISEDSMSRQPSPFSTIGSLTAYALALVEKQTHGPL
jgi:hypothetical protein